MKKGTRMKGSVSCDDDDDDEEGGEERNAMPVRVSETVR
jgi:hypothetical protein